MILEDFLEIKPAGIYCPYGNFYLDPQMAVAQAVISHAHADHAVSGNKDVFCTPATAAFMQHRYKKNATENFSLYSYGEAFKLGEVEISFHSAGHILGSAQILMQHRGVKYLYTGDFKLQADATCEAYSFVQADVLITETTFANPHTKHPEPAEEIQKLNGESINIMLGAYALGKSQNLIYLINQFCPHKTILLHHNIMPFAKIYEHFGIDLGKYQVYDRKLMKQNPEGFVYIVPPMVFNAYYKANNVKKAFASGWQRLQQGNDIQLLISDHADWSDILHTVAQTNPSQIWTLHGDGKQLQGHLSGKIEVRILDYRSE